MSSIQEPWEITPTHRVDYQYDGRGIRVGRTEQPSGYPQLTASREYIYSPELQLLSISRDDNPNIWGKRVVTNAVFTPKLDFFWLAGIPVAQFDAESSVLRYTHTDHLGTPIAQTDATGAFVWLADYEPYGNIYQTRIGSPADQLLRFPGQERATTWEGTEENYNIFRWYRSGWGRYTQADPIRPSEKRPVSFFDYALDNPIRNIDSTGLYAVNGFSDPDAEALNKAIKKVWDFINKQPCNCLSKYPFQFRENMRNALIAASFKFDQGLTDCGITPPYVNIITLGPSAFTGCKPCLAATVLHELAHAAGATDLDNSNPITGPSAYQIERECKACGP
jgi:RHS repeat-associated protein